MSSNLTSTSRILDLQSLSYAYFEAWNAHDATRVGACFAADGTLRDWNIAVVGVKKVADANQTIFEAAPDIHADVLGITASGLTTACELLIHLHDTANTVIKVVDWIEFQPDGKIKALRAYKG